MSDKCNKCGQCCRELIIEIKHSDIIREPKLRETARLLDGNGVVQFINEDDKIYGLPTPCRFLDAKNRCEIYNTRPDVCREFAPGCAICDELNFRKEVSDE